jgi:hypothetical protein
MNTMTGHKSQGRSIFMIPRVGGIDEGQGGKRIDADPTLLDGLQHISRVSV